MYGNNIATGTVEGTGADIVIQCGFQPRAVTLLNIDGLARLEWTETMGAGYGFKTADTGAGVTDLSLLSSLGVTAYAGSEAANSEGFTIGADTDVNVSAETIEYIAYR